MTSDTSTFSIGVDLGGTNIKFAVISEAGEVVSRRTIPTDGHEGHDAVLGRMVQGATALRNEIGSQSAIEAVGVGVPGMLDMRNGITLDLPNLPGKWPNVAVKEIMEAALHVPVHLINDVKAFTIAELELGAAQGARNVVCYAVGTGIGGGVVFDGKVHFGIGGAAGELGHIIVNPSGVRCSCGNRGCVEALASGPAIIGEANRRIVQGFTTRLTTLVHDDLNRMSPAVVEQAAEEGDEVAREVLERAGHYLGLSMAGMIAALAPDVVVVGGGVVKPHGVYWKSFEATARANNTVTDMSRVSFVPATLGYQAGVIGAALWGRMVERGESSPTA
jgi:glucokinase